MEFPNLLRSLSHAAIALVLGASACSDATTSADSNIRFVLDSGSAPLSTGANSTANAAGGPGVIVVSGRIVLPSPCFTLSPRVIETPGALELTILAQPSGDACVAVLTSRGYTLRVGSLASGVYHVRLTHDIEGPTPLRELVLEKDVRVD